MLGTETVYGQEHELNISNGVTRRLRQGQEYCCSNVSRLLDDPYYEKIRKDYGIPVGNSGSTDDRFWLYNGGCFYYDMCHWEYCTPECSTLKDIVSYTHAGYQIASDLLKRADLQYPQKHRHYVLANGTDHVLDAYKKVATFGIHENYSLKSEAEVTWMRQQTIFQAFMASRIIITGAGYVTPHRAMVPFGLSERASLRTLEFNPHNEGDSRLEIKGSDPNICPVSIALKYGITDLVLRLTMENINPLGKDSIGDTEMDYFRTNLSANPHQFKDYQILGTSRKWYNAIDIQRRYLAAAKRRFSKSGDPELVWVLDMWRRTLDVLDTDFTKADWLDWVIKYNYLEKMRTKGGYKWKDFRDFDRSYHAVDTDRSVYGLISKYPLPSVDIQKATLKPPQTRASWRSEMLKSSGSRLTYVSWDRIVVDGNIIDRDNPH